MIKLKDIFADHLGDYTFDFEFIATLAYNLCKQGQDLERLGNDFWFIKNASDCGNWRPADALTRDIKKWVTYKVTTGADATSVNETKFEMAFLREFTRMMMWTMTPDAVYKAFKGTVCDYFDKKDKKIPDVERYAILADFRRTIKKYWQTMTGKKCILHNTQNV